VPAGVLQTLPSFWRGEKLLAVPYFDTHPESAHGCSAQFVAPEFFPDGMRPILTRG